MKSQYFSGARMAIDNFWRKNHCPPTIRDIMDLSGIPSTSMVVKICKYLPGIRCTETGKYIPEWVDELFEKSAALEGADPEAVAKILHMRVEIDPSLPANQWYLMAGPKRR